MLGLQVKRQVGLLFSNEKVLLQGVYSSLLLKGSWSFITLSLLLPPLACFVNKANYFPLSLFLYLLLFSNSFFAANFPFKCTLLTFTSAL